MRFDSLKGSKTHILTIALEDYFHGPAFSKVISRKRWGHFETRFEQNSIDVLDRLDEATARATFFVNSWVARKHPLVLREVITRGHEIALAGQRGLSFRHLNRASLREQTQRDRDILEQQTSRQVLGFRVTDVLLEPKDLWALEELAALGFKYDSSLSPFLRRFQSESWRQHIHQNACPPGDIWEVPLSSASLGGMLIPFAGGNYFRQFPEWLIRKFLDLGSQREGHPLVLYFRLWDFDSQQPRLQTGSWIRDFRHYRNSERMLAMMDDLLTRFRFTSISEHLALPVPSSTGQSSPREPAARFSSARIDRARTPISVIVPCYNEEEGIAFLASNLASLKNDLASQYDTKFVIVDDGSKDQTWTLLQKHFSDDADSQLIRHAANQGVSAAIMTGLQHAREIACSIDCDCSYDPGELRPMLNLLTPDVDLVTASPYHPAGAVLNVPGWRLFLSRISSAMYRLVTGRNLHTFTACVRVYRRSNTIGTQLRYTGFLGVAELLGKMALSDKRIVEHPATLEVRIFGQSKMKVVRTIIGHLKLLGELGVMRLKAHMDEKKNSPIHSVVSTVRFPVEEPADAEVEKAN
jgi:polysaccharide deacetylase family protein (PEP-CTERM system associated)